MARYTYSLTVANAGPSNATSVTATDSLPAGVTFVSAPGCDPNASGTVVTCTIGNLTAAGSVTRTITVTAPATSGTITNTASVTGSETDPNTANNSATATTLVQAAPPACSRSSAVWLTGMEHGVVSTAGGGIFSTLTGTPTADNAVFRDGAYSLRIDDASGASTERALRSFAASSVVVARFAIRLSSLPGVNSNLAYI